MYLTVFGFTVRLLGTVKSFLPSSEISGLTVYLLSLPPRHLLEYQHLTALKGYGITFVRYEPPYYSSLCCLCTVNSAIPKYLNFSLGLIGQAIS